MKRTLRILRTVLLAVLVAFVFRSYLFASYIVDGESMEPTLFDGNLLMVNKVIYDYTDISRQDVIVFHANPEEDYVKRVIGIPGDTIHVEDDVLYVNGDPVEEEYLKSFRVEDGRPFTRDFTLQQVTGYEHVPEGHLFVMGDNRRDSLDSRAFGFVPIDTVVGKVDVLYWPISHAALTF